MTRVMMTPSEACVCGMITMELNTAVWIQREILTAIDVYRRNLTPDDRELDAIRRLRLASDGMNAVISDLEDLLNGFMEGLE